MGSCIICGTSVDGRICEHHEEDVVFEFRGRQPGELTDGRYYRGTVDGYADFGLFVDIGDSVTGLLHRSELDQRLESLDLEPGDTVFVQVQNVRDNGNIDLGWSIRQDESQFRGTLIDDPDVDGELLADEEGEEGNADSGTVPPEPEPVERGGAGGDGAAVAEAAGADRASSRDTDEPEPDEGSAEPPEPDAVTVDLLGEHVGARVRLEGEVASARQTSGPTVFELRDETGSVECAAFEEAGVRAYPEIGEGDIVRLEGEVERRRGDLQVETEALVLLEDEEREAVSRRMEDAMVKRARPETVEALAADPAVEAVADGIRDAATAIRRAVFEGRPVVVRHAATADGYAASVAIERATLPLVREEHGTADAEYHYFDRRPLEGSVYDMDDATRDVTTMLSNRERHGEQVPLFVFVAAGGTTESVDAFDLLDVYDARRVVVDERAIEAGIEAAVDVLVAPALADQKTTATALGANIAAAVNGDVRPDLAHLPAVSFWEGAPESYRELAAEAGYDEADTDRLRQAIALEAYYQSYEDKRQLVVDLLFADEAEDPLELAGQISEQFRVRMDRELETAEANLDGHDVDGRTVLVLDTDAYTHRYEFPPDPLLLDELYRRHRRECAALVGVATDEAYIRTDADVDVRELVEAARANATDAALDARGARDGRVEFLAGEREAARDALLEALVAELEPAAA